jgi:hypothetical protein
MFVTIAFMYLVATTGFTGSMGMALGTVLVDLWIITAIESIGKAWATGTIQDEEFWNGGDN